VTVNVLFILLCSCKVFRMMSTCFSDRKSYFYWIRCQNQIIIFEILPVLLDMFVKWMCFVCADLKVYGCYFYEGRKAKNEPICVFWNYWILTGTYLFIYVPISVRYFQHKMIFFYGISPFGQTYLPLIMWLLLPFPSSQFILLYVLLFAGIVEMST
jgi:hypothetical protein